MRPGTHRPVPGVGTGYGGGLAVTAVVLVLVALTSGRDPAATTVLGCLLAVIVGLRPERRALGTASRATAAPSAASGVTPSEDSGAGLQVRWWRRGGHDRLYVSDTSGRSLGWLDRETGRLHVLEEDDRRAVEHAVSMRAPAGASDSSGAEATSSR